ncbi:glycosyltransferase [Oceanitalea stevensii]|uniref:Glycosyltransferase n=1 Tax=Oceanitalea stevensii TaxID=2763072 RepID=A0ABR8Z468_9MICO|nr:glycosyltransferase [Oceanitalea stevensii]MBD8063117.1 glycosyltransferase [Oceanitalea stevensii]
MTELPRPDGRATRVAMLVYNDAHADSRVLKTAHSLREAGAEVTILAVARAHLGYPPTTERLPDGVELVRVREPGFITWVPRLKKALARVRTQLSARRGTATTPPPGASAPTPPAESRISPAASPRPALRGAVLAKALDPVDRLARTAILVHYWAMAVREGRRRRPDVVHANDGNTLVPGRLIARRTGAALVYDAHELWRHRNVRDRPVGKHVEALTERVVIRRADGVVTVSPSIARWLQRTYGLRELPTLVRNIPAAGEPTDPARGRLRQLAGLAPTDQVIAYGGRITTSRGLEETIAALALLPGHVHLVVLGYGDPGYLAQLDRRIEQAGVRDRVHLVGKVAPHEVAGALADADLSVVFVRPTCLSYEYSLPNKLFEAIHAGLPIAAADLPDTREVVERYGVGEIFGLVRPDDDGEVPPSSTDAEAVAMAATITRILADPDAYRRAARAAASELTWQHEEEALLALYRRVLR